jgi:hypothetical protein
MTRYTTKATLITNGDRRRGVDYGRCGCLVSEGPMTATTGRDQTWARDGHQNFSVRASGNVAGAEEYDSVGRARRRTA